MKLFDKFTAKVFSELPQKPEKAEKELYTGRFEEISNFYFAENCQYVPLLQIHYHAKAFYLRFYVLNRKLCGYHGITADDPLVHLFAREGSWSEDFREHIAAALKWCAGQQVNASTVPEFRKIDPVDEILHALPPEVMKYNYWRHYDCKTGNHRQSVAFEIHHNFEAELYAGFSPKNMCWMLEFEIVRYDCSGKTLLDTTFDSKHKFFELYADYLPPYKEGIITRISDALIWLYNIQKPGWQEPFPPGGKQDTVYLKGVKNE